MRKSILISSLLLVSCIASHAIDKFQSMRKAVWTEWCKKQCAADTLPSFSIAPLEERATMAWHLPENLEPHATMSFYSGTKGEKGNEGYPVFLYLHGSGPRSIEWNTGISLASQFDDSPSAYIIPQIPNEGEWYRWWQKSKIWAWKNLFRKVLMSNDYDPSRIYLFGISEGGYGSQRLASYYADYLAAAGPMAGGEPLRNAPVENLSNIAFSFLTGERDNMFFRNKLTQATAQALDSMEHLFPQEYLHRVELVPGKAHSIDYSTTTPWLSKYKRNAIPRHFIWENMEMDGIKRNAFYNIEILEECSTFRTRYEYTANNNNIELLVNDIDYETTWRDPIWNIDMIFAKHFTPSKHGHIVIYLSEQTFNLSKPISIYINGKLIKTVKAKANKQVMKRSCELWGDPLRLFPAAIDVEWHG